MKMALTCRFGYNNLGRLYWQAMSYGEQAGPTFADIIYEVVYGGMYPATNSDVARNETVSLISITLEQSGESTTFLDMLIGQKAPGQTSTQMYDKRHHTTALAGYRKFQHWETLSPTRCKYATLFWLEWIHMLRNRNNPLYESTAVTSLLYPIYQRRSNHEIYTPYIVRVAR